MSCDSSGKIIPRGNDKESNLPCDVPTCTKAIATPGGRFLRVGEDEIHFGHHVDPGDLKVNHSRHGR